MSSLVRFIVGNTAGRDHIYWPTLSQAQYDLIVAGGTLPAPYKNAARASCTLAQIMACCWRIKEWSFSGGWSAADTGTSVSCTIENSPTPNVAKMKTAYPGNDDTINNAPVLFDVVDENFIASEFLASVHTPPEYITDYIQTLRNYGFLSPLTSVGLGAGHLRMTRTLTPVLPAPPSVVTDTAARLFFFGDRRRQGGAGGPFGDSRGMDIVIFGSGVFKPLFRFDDVAIVGGNYVCATPTSETPNASFEIDPVVAPSFTAPLVIKALFPPLVSSSCDLKMTASKFFPYKNSEGLSVYDENSGAQLRDPFS